MAIGIGNQHSHPHLGPYFSMGSVLAALALPLPAHGFRCWPVVLFQLFSPQATLAGVGDHEATLNPINLKEKADPC